MTITVIYEDLNILRTRATYNCTFVLTFTTSVFSNVVDWPSPLGITHQTQLSSHVLVYVGKSAGDYFSLGQLDTVCLTPKFDFIEQ